MKQSAVEWLYEKIKSNIDAEDGSMNMNWLHDDTFQQAKEMEKQQQGYSEEEVLDILREHTAEIFKGSKLTLTEWFEQFKNK